MTDQSERHEAAIREISRRMREWPPGNTDERFRFGTAAIHVLPAHGISTRKTEALYHRWVAEHGPAPQKA